MILAGIIAIVFGGGLCVYGYTENNNLANQVISVLSGGGTDPGTPYLISGIVIFIIGVILLLYGFKKKQG